MKFFQIIASPAAPKELTTIMQDSYYNQPATPANVAVLHRDAQDFLKFGKVEKVPEAIYVSGTNNGKTWMVTCKAVESSFLNRKPKKTFIAAIFKDHFINNIDQSKSNWFHNYMHVYNDEDIERDFPPIKLILEYFMPGPNNINVLDMLSWLECEEGPIPPTDFQENTLLLWNLFYLVL